MLFLHEVLSHAAQGRHYDMLYHSYDPSNDVPKDWYNPKQCNHKWIFKLVAMPKPILPLWIQVRRSLSRSLSFMM